jgi:hypothetical protein
VLEESPAGLLLKETRDRLHRIIHWTVKRVA